MPRLILKIDYRALTCALGRDRYFLGSAGAAYKMDASATDRPRPSSA
jgi:hypothetical protein